MSNLLSRSILALDNMSYEELNNFLESNPSDIPTLKIGLELFCLHGPSIVKEIREKYRKTIFLDLKLHDIPNTVAKAIRSLEGLDVEFLTIHLSGGEEMINKALESAKTYLPNTKLLGVSYLTSLDEKDFSQNWGVNKDGIEDQFKKLFSIASKTKIHGIVCSPLEAKMMKEIDSNILTVCPGIRFEDQISSGNIQDQKRVLSPLQALTQGADYMVIGRPLTQAQNFNERVTYLTETKIT